MSTRADVPGEPDHLLNSCNGCPSWIRTRVVDTKNRSATAAPRGSSLQMFKSFLMVRPAGFEPATTRLEVSCSIQLSYGRIIRNEENYYFPIAIRIHQQCQRSFANTGAGEGNRTLVSSLEGCSFTIKLRPLRVFADTVEFRQLHRNSLPFHKDFSIKPSDQILLLASFMAISF